MSVASAPHTYAEAQRQAENPSLLSPQMSSGTQGQNKKGAMTKGRAYRISGMIKDSRTGAPLKGFTVKVFDKEVLNRWTLGQAVTDSVGRYEIHLEPGLLPESFVRLERSPGVLVRIYNQAGRLVKSTASPLIVESGADTRIDVYLDEPEVNPYVRTQNVIDGWAVNLSAIKRLSSRELLEVYRYLKSGRGAFQRLGLVRQAFPTLMSQHKVVQECGEQWATFIEALLQRRGASYLLEQRPFGLPPDAIVRRFFTPNVMVTYTTDPDFPDESVKDQTVPTEDQELILPDGTPHGISLGFIRAAPGPLNDDKEVAPIYVQKIGLIAEYALNRFINPPFSLRDPRRDELHVQVTICAISGALGETSPEQDDIEVLPDNSDLINFNVVPHELFHRVQYRYNDTLSHTGIYSILREGGARFGEDCISDTTNHYVHSSQFIFNHPAQSLLDGPFGHDDEERPYAFGLLWKYLAEQHSLLITSADEPAIGIDAYRHVLEATATVLSTDPHMGYDPKTLRLALSQMSPAGSFDEFRYFDPLMTELNTQETAWGNFLVANYLHVTANPHSDSRFDYMEDEERVNWPPLSMAPVHRLSELQSKIETPDDLILGQGEHISRTVVGHKAYAAKYYRITPNSLSRPGLLRVSVSAYGGMTDPLIQILRLGPGEALVDINRSDQPAYTKTINMQGLSSVVVIIASRFNAGDFTVEFDEVQSGPDVMATRWNTKAGTEYEINPAGGAWNWISPDVMVDSNDDLLPDDYAIYGRNNKLKVRLRNLGSAAAGNIKVEFWYRKYTTEAAPDPWLPVQDAAHVTQSVSEERLSAKGEDGDQKWVAVNWSPVSDGTDNPRLLVKLKITVPGDPNSDNKIALSTVRVIVP